MHSEALHGSEVTSRSLEMYCFPQGIVCHLRYADAEVVKVYRPRELGLSADFPFQVWYKGKPTDVSGTRPDRTAAPFWPLIETLAIAHGRYDRITTCTSATGKDGATLLSIRGRKYYDRRLARIEQGRVVQLDDYAGACPTLKFSDFDTSFPAVPHSIVETWRIPDNVTTTVLDSIRVLRADEIYDVVRRLSSGKQRIHNQSGSDYEDTSYVDLPLVDESGRQVSLRDYAGKGVLVFVWASWDTGSSRVLQELKECSQRFGGSSSLAVVGLNVDADPAAAHDAALRLGMNWTQLRMKGDVVQARKLPVNSIPAVILLRPNGATYHWAQTYEVEWNSIVKGNGSKSRNGLPDAVAKALKLWKRQQQSGGENLSAIDPLARKALGKATSVDVCRLHDFKTPDGIDPEWIGTTSDYLVLACIHQQDPAFVKQVSDILLDERSYVPMNPEDCGCGRARLEWPEFLDHSEDIETQPEEDIETQPVHLAFCVRQGNSEVQYEIWPDGTLQALLKSETRGSRAGGPVFRKQAFHRIQQLVRQDAPEVLREASAKLERWQMAVRRFQQDTVTSEGLTPIVGDLQVWQGNKAILLSWRNPAPRRVVLLRGTEWDNKAIPEHGRQYSAGEKIRNFEVVYTGSLDSFLDSNLENNKTYYYRLYAVDEKGNYSPGRRIVAHAGRGLRAMSQQHMSETFRVVSGRPAETSTDFRQVFRDIGPTEEPPPKDRSGARAWGKLVRMVDVPGKGSIPFGTDSIKLVEDKHPPVGGLATYSALLP